MKLYRVTVPVMASKPTSVAEALALGLALRRLRDERREYYGYVVRISAAAAKGHYDVQIVINARRAISPDEWALERRQCRADGTPFDPLGLLQWWLDDGGAAQLEELLGDATAEVVEGTPMTLWERSTVEEMV